jgi:hypothetical protein
MNTTHWLSVPLARVNVSAVATTAIAMLFLLSYHPEDVQPEDFIRGNALVLLAAHGALHALTLHSLKFLQLLDFAEASTALARYRDPRRVSHLDLAAAWLGFYALAPHIAAS